MILFSAEAPSEVGIDPQLGATTSEESKEPKTSEELEGSVPKRRSVGPLLWTIRGIFGIGWNDMKRL